MLTKKDIPLKGHNEFYSNTSQRNNPMYELPNNCYSFIFLDGSEKYKRTLITWEMANNKEIHNPQFYSLGQI